MDNNGLEIAVVGMAGRFPGARDIDELWELLRQGKEGISSWSAEELIQAGLPSTLVNRPDYVRRHGYLQGKDLFDAELFGYSPRDASFLDPQFSTLHECAWSALENAGFEAAQYSGSIGLFAGAGGNSSWLLNHVLSRGDAAIDYFTASTLVAHDFLAARIAYKLDLTGPAVTVQTACSTSLVAVHLACQSLINGECDLALAGGATVTPLGKQGYVYDEGMILSADGHCRTFDAQASGTVPGEGVALVVLQRLEDARAHGANILAVIKGSAINNDGRQKAGFTAPGVAGQVSVIRAAHAMADVTPDSISYVEAHGTGTILGDPIEIDALTQAFAGAAPGSCWIGSVKSNLGHLDAAAGITGLIKVILALREGELPPSLHFERPNPRIDFQNSPFRVNTSLRRWPSANPPRRAGVSSFGIGGTNAHVVVEEYTGEWVASGCRQYKLVSLSANSQSALSRLQEKLLHHLDTHPELPAEDVCYTLHVGRKHLLCRAAFVVRSTAEIVTRLRKQLEQPGGASEPVTAGATACFLFPGQGAQYWNMGRGLYDTEPVFRETMDRCLAISREIGAADLETHLFGAGQVDANDRINRTAIAQPLLFMVEYSLAQLLMSWGCRPASMIGHSVGEYVAACVAEVFSLRDAIRLLVRRGELMQDMPRGAMLAVAGLADPSRLGPGLSIAAINTPTNTVLSGDEDAIVALQSRLQAEGAECVRVRVSHAFHSHHMEPVLSPLRRLLETVQFSAPRIPFISTLTGDWVSAEEVTSVDYWVRQARECVRFSDALGRVGQRAGQVLLEVGPGRTLTAFVRQSSAPGAQPPCLPLMRSRLERVPDQHFLIDSLGQAYAAGMDVNWRNFYQHERRARIALPEYPFEGKRHWGGGSSARAQSAVSAKTGVPPQIEHWQSVPTWELAAPAPAMVSGSTSREWLIFADETGIGQRLQEELLGRGEPVTMVRMGTRLGRLGSGMFVMNPRSKSDYLQVLAEANRSRSTILTVVHLWGVYGFPEQLSAAMRFDYAQERGLNSAVLLTQALAQEVPHRFCHVSFIGTNIVRCLGDTTLHPEKSTIVGFSRVIGQECPKHSARVIDLALEADGRWEGHCGIGELLEELARPAYDSLVAFRQGTIWKQVFRPFPLPVPVRSPLLARGGAYLITGGLGRIGMVLIEHLCAVLDARVIVTIRATVPPEREWDDWLRDNASHPLHDRIQRIRHLKKQGRFIEIRSADVCDARAMEEVFSWVDTNIGVLNGVFHAAAHVREGLIEDMTCGDVAR